MPRLFPSAFFRMRRQAALLILALSGILLLALLPHVSPYVNLIAALENGLRLLLAYGGIMLALAHMPSLMSAWSRGARSGLSNGVSGGVSSGGAITLLWLSITGATLCMHYGLSLMTHRPLAQTLCQTLAQTMLAFGLLSAVKSYSAGPRWRAQRGSGLLVGSAALLGLTVCLLSATLISDSRLAPALPWLILLNLGLALAGALALSSSSNLPPALTRNLLAAAITLMLSNLCGMSAQVLALDDRQLIDLLALAGLAGQLLCLLFISVAMLGVSKLTLARRLRQTLQVKLSAQRRLTAELRALRENERRLVARSLHDELGQLLGVIANELALQRQQMPQAEFALAEKPLARLEQALTPAISVLRRIAADLHPRGLEDGGLFFALNELTRQFSQRHGIACELKVNEADLPVDPVRAVALYRIVVEALDNVQRHARARHVVVSSWRIGGTLHFAVTDDGRGMPANGIASARFGLADAAERLQALQGSLQIKGTAGDGTRLEAYLPMSQHS